MTVDATPPVCLRGDRATDDFSFSGKAFSVTIGRGRFRLPEARVFIGTGLTVVVDDLADLPSEEIPERRHDLGEPRAGPPFVMTARH